MVEVAMQHGLFGDVMPADKRAALMRVLTSHDDARNHYMAAIARFWLEFDGLGALLDRGCTDEEFVAWMVNHATSAKTLQNRAGELQNKYPDLEADPDVEQQRQAQARAGVVW